MTEQEKRRAIQEFFCAPRPVYHQKYILQGAGVAVVGLLLFLGNPSFFAFLVLAVGVGLATLRPFTPERVPGYEQHADPTEYFSVLAYGAAQRRYDARPDGQQILGWFWEDLGGVVRDSYDNVGLSAGGATPDDETLVGIGGRVRDTLGNGGGETAVAARTDSSKKPLIVFGPLYDSKFLGFDDAMVRRRKLPDSDDWMYSTWNVAVFHFTDYDLRAYRANYNMMKNVAVMEEVDEVYYKDVVAVKTSIASTNVALSRGMKMEHSKVFCLTVSSGHQITVSLGGEGVHMASSLESRNDENIRNIRAMLRTFKEAAVEGRPVR